MISFLQKKIKRYINRDFFIVFIVLVMASLIPIIKTYGRLDIGHDTFIPLRPEFSYKMAYQWNDTDNGIYYSNNYFEWIPIFHFFTSLGLNIYQRVFVFQFLIYFLSGLGILKIFNLFNKNSALFALIPALAFILSPYQFDHLVYYQGTVGIIWSIYFIFKFIKFKKFEYSDIIFLSIAFGIITDLPNPKYHFILILIIASAISLALILKEISLKNIVSNAKNLILFLLCTLYLSLPFLYFGYSFLGSTGKIFVKAGYRETGQTLDFGYALLSKMIRLFHTPNLNASNTRLINMPIFLIAYYFIPIIVFGILPLIIRHFDKSSKKIYLIFYILALLSIFLSKSSNPPFGFIYELPLSTIKGLAFMRTTAGIVIFAAVFYALIYGRIFQSIVENSKINKWIKRFILIILLFTFLITGYPIWSGQYFLSRSTINNYLDQTKFGLLIPKDYFDSATFLKQFKLDSKLDVYPFTNGYQNNRWGYYGYIIYPWLFYQPSISPNKTTIEGKTESLTNARYILHDKTLEDNYPISYFWQKPQKLLFSSAKIDIYQKSDVDFIPHFYTAKSLFATSVMTTQLLKKISSEQIAIILNQKKENISGLKLIDSTTLNPIIEYKKIDPTKYHIKIHKARGPFTLVFTENFNPLWKLYMTKKEITFETADSLIYKTRNYKIYKNNEDDQANNNEIKTFIKNGLITQLNNSHVDFVSRNFKGTIQNDNLNNGTFAETLFKKSLDQQHFQVNGYANGWVIKPEELCSNKNQLIKCQKNDGGTYDFELIVEFWPQRLSSISYFISITTMLLILFYSSIKFLFSLNQSMVLRKPRSIE